MRKEGGQTRQGRRWDRLAGKWVGEARQGIRGDRLHRGGGGRA